MPPVLQREYAAEIPDPIFGRALLRGIERCPGRHDRDAAIKAVHTLTGQARSFGFIRLEKKSAALLQALRGNQDEEITELRYEVTTEYIRIVHAIRSLASELGIFM